MTQRLDDAKAAFHAMHFSTFVHVLSHGSSVFGGRYIMGTISAVCVASHRPQTPEGFFQCFRVLLASHLLIQITLEHVSQ